MAVDRDSRPDPRLVFMHDSEPFLEREVNSGKEAGIWSCAERAVADFAQRKSRSVLGVSAFVSFSFPEMVLMLLWRLVVLPFPGDVFSI